MTVDVSVTVGKDDVSVLVTRLVEVTVMDDVTVVRKVEVALAAPAKGGNEQSIS